ncbi:MAG TPA: hypothetical protein PKO28_04700 [Bacilli bacterium]|nr:hypothetical protein [Bacilli bacterium]
MAKISRVLTAFGALVLLSLSSFGNNFTPANAEDSDSNHFVNRTQTTNEVECGVNVSTISPWVSNANVEISFPSSSLASKSYLALDIDVLESKNNPELIMRLGANGVTFGSPDNVTIPGSPTSIQKMWGDWFFFPVGRTTIFISIANYMPSLSDISSFGFYFDTGVSGRSGKMIIRGLYLTSGQEVHEDDTDIMQLSDLTADVATSAINDSRYTSLGVDSSKVGGSEGTWNIDGVALHSSFENSLKIHVKATSEGGQASEAPNDYGFLTLDYTDHPIDISGDDGFAFSVYAPKKETYFRIYVEDTDGHFYQPDVNGVSTSQSIMYPMIYNELPSSIMCFYNAFYLDEKTGGTVYVPYEDFIPVTYFQESDRESGPSTFSSIKKIHIGLDMLYGLRRYVMFSEFASVSIADNTINAFTRFSDLSASEWNRDSYLFSTVVKCQENDLRKGNFVIAEAEEEDQPGAITPIDLTQLNSAIGLSKTLDKSKYTKDSWNKLSKALITANNILEYSFLYSQVDIDNATIAVMYAIRTLEFKEPTNNLSLYIILGSIALALIVGGIITTAVVVKKKKGAKAQ